MAERSLLLVLSNSTGGIGVHVRALAASCVHAGYDVTVCGPAATDAVFDFGATGARFVALPVRLALLTSRSGRRALSALASRHRVVHAHGLQAGMVTGVAVPRSRPLVVTWHNAPLSGGFRRWVHPLLERLTARRADVTVGASADLVLRAELAGARDARFVAVAPPEMAPPSADAATLRRRWALADRPLVLAVGRLHRQKRFDVMVTAAAAWQQRVPAAAVLIAGEGPERDSLRRQASALGVEVRLLGQRQDVADLMSIADVVVLPSSWEARPLVAQEALAAGRALVATGVGGVPSLVGRAAVLVPVGDAAALAAAVTALLDDAEARHQLEREALVQAAGWPDAETVAVRLRSIYAELGDRT